MKTIVISGGTDGMGRALARTYLQRGHRVVIIGLDAQKGAAFLDAAGRIDAGSRAHFIRADLSLIEENGRVVEEIEARSPVVDALVLCARHYRTTRLETADGFEHTFALFYLSRFLLGHGLAEAMERADEPVIMNVAGPGSSMGTLHWDDLEFRRDYDGNEALQQGGRLNDLLGVAFAGTHPASRIRYVLFNPGSVATSLSGEYDAATAAHVESIKRFGRPVEEGIAPIIAVLDAPPAEPLSAFVLSRRISLRHEAFDAGAAIRLHDLTRELLSRAGVSRS